MEGLQGKREDEAGGVDEGLLRKEGVVEMDVHGEMEWACGARRRDGLRIRGMGEWRLWGWMDGKIRITEGFKGRQRRMERVVGGW